MTYKELVDRFKQVADQHYMIKDFGYGLLSDIKVHSQDREADYPYMFLNYTTHQRSGTVMTYNFNLIMMDIATDEDDELSNYTAIQSKCQQYIDDVIAELYYGYTDKPEIDYSNVTYTPFKERFQDTVAGMTATISIDVPTPINRCIAPFPTDAPIPPTPTPISIEVTEGEATNEACNNGTVTFRISGGSLPQVLEYNGSSYNITNQVGTILQTSNETVGTRTWTLTENDGTIHTGQVSIICTYEPVGPINILVDMIAATDQFCADGIVTFTVSGGTLPQTLQFDGSTYNLTEPTNIVEIPNLIFSDYTWTITEFDGTVHTSTVEVICTNPNYTVVKTAMLGANGVSWINNDPTTAYCLFVDAVEPFEYEFFDVRLVDLPLQVGTQLFDPFGDPSTFTGTLVYQDESGLITPQNAVNPKVMVVANGVISSIIEGSSIVCPTPGACLEVVDVFSTSPQNFRPDAEQSPVSCTNIVLNDGGWRPPQEGGNFYVPQTSDPLTWTITGTVYVTRVDFGDVLNPFVIEDTGNQTFYQPTTIIGWPETTPPVDTQFSFELIYNNVIPSGSGIEAALNFNTPEPQAEFFLLEGTNITICREGVTS